MRADELFEILENVDENKIDAAGVVAFDEEKHRRIKPLTFAAAVCLCAALIVGIAAIKQGHNVDTTDLFINEVKNVVYSDIDVQITRLSELSEEGSEIFLKEFEAAAKVSIDTLGAKIPDGFVCDSFYLIKKRDYGTKNDYIPHDYVLEYSSNGKGSIKVALSSVSAPLRDVYIDDKDPKPTIINDVSMYVFFYNKTYIVQFCHSDVYYDIEAVGITPDALTDLLINITT